MSDYVNPSDISFCSSDEMYHNCRNIVYLICGFLFNTWASEIWGSHDSDSEDYVPGMWSNVVWWTVTKISQEPTAFVSYLEDGDCG